jgi:hypothetical protein
MVTGDAFTSAEGVDTEKAWPRLLERDLTQNSGKPVEVLNFAITGYGPNQYSAVVQKYAPVYRPDMIIVETYVNDFQDVLFSNADFQQSIGFGEPAPDSLYAILRLEQLRRFIRLQVVEYLSELVRGKPRAEGYFLGNFLALERGRPELEDTGRQKVFEQLSQIRTVADQIGATVVVFMVPAPVQICRPDQLAYYPRNVDINDTSQYDLDLPQRTMGDIAHSLGLAFYDLRPVMKSVSGECPYQAHNMHWTQSGHQIAATYLSNLLTEVVQKP